MSAKPSHTPEPWVPPDERGRDGYWRVTRSTGGRTVIAYCHTRGDSARIVACVNACAGLNPEAVPEFVAACEDAFGESTTYECPETGDYVRDCAAKGGTEWCSCVALCAALAKSRVR